VLIRDITGFASLRPIFFCDCVTIAKIVEVWAYLVTVQTLGLPAFYTTLTRSIHCRFGRRLPFWQLRGRNMPFWPFRYRNAKLYPGNRFTSRSIFSHCTRIVKEKVSVADGRGLRYTLPDSKQRPRKRNEETMSALRKILSLGMLFAKGEGWEIHPLSSKVFVLLSGNRSFLSDGERFVEKDSFQACLDTRTTFRRLTFGESLK